MELEVLQRIVALLKADAAVSALVGTKIYDRPPHENGAPAVASPYISLGPHDGLTEDSDDCMDLVELTFQVDAWSWGDGVAYSRAEVSNIASAVRSCLHRQEITITGAAVEIQHQMTRVMRDPDGETNHAALTFTAAIDA